LLWSAKLFRIGRIRRIGRIDPESDAIGGVGLLAAEKDRPAYIRRAWQTAAIMIPYIVVIRTIVRSTTQRF
jgi:hypothetical protein